MGDENQFINQLHAQVVELAISAPKPNFCDEQRAKQHIYDILGIPKVLLWPRKSRKPKLVWNNPNPPAVR